AHRARGPGRSGHRGGTERGGGRGASAEGRAGPRRRHPVRTRREVVAWAALGAIALALRLAYVAAQPGTDPTFARPMLDEALYVGWARGLAAGGGQPPGAFYLAPLYPNVLALWAAAGAG